jgi:hypothetical protein
MKKLLVALLILLAATGVVSAQRLRFTGNIMSGLDLVFAKDGQEDPLLRSWTGRDSNMSYRLQLRGLYNNAESTVGVDFQFRMDDKPTNNTTREVLGQIYWDFFGYGWFRAFNKHLQVKFGVIQEGTFNTTGGVGDDVGEGPGVFAIYSYGFPTENFFRGNLQLGFGAFTNNVASQIPTEVKWDQIKYRGDIAYAFSKGFKLNLGYVTHSNALADSNVNQGIEKTSQLIAGLGISKFQKYGFTRMGVDIKISNMGGPTGFVIPANTPFPGATVWGNAYAPTITYGERVEWTKEAISLGLWGEQIIRDVPDTIFGTRTTFWAIYKFSNTLSTRLDLGHSRGNNNNSTTINTIGATNHNPDPGLSGFWRYTGRDVIGLNTNKDKMSFMVGLNLPITIGRFVFTPGGMYVGDVSKADPQDPLVMAYIDCYFSF